MFFIRRKITSDCSNIPTNCLVPLKGKINWQHLDKRRKEKIVVCMHTKYLFFYICSFYEACPADMRRQHQYYYSYGPAPTYPTCYRPAVGRGMFSSTLALAVVGSIVTFAGLIKSCMLVKGWKNKKGTFNCDSFTLLFSLLLQFYSTNYHSLSQIVDLG